MNIKRIGSVAAIAIAGAIVLSSCAANEDSGSGASSSSSASASSAGSSVDYSSLSGTLNGVGSSAQGTAETTWISGFQGLASSVTVNYNPAGSGAGLTSFISGAADFAGSDAALADTDLASTFQECKAGTKGIDLPIYISPIAIAYKIDGVKNLTLDANTIAGIFKGTITKWNDPAITKLNKGVTLPSAAINVVHRSDNSGTTANFTDYLAQNASSVWTAPASQTYPYQIGDSAAGTSGVASAMASATDAITYIDDSGAGSLDKAKLVVGSTATKISASGAAAVVADSPLVTGRAKNDLALALNRKDTAKGAWPLVLVSYGIACQQYSDSSKAALVKAYLGYAASAAGQQAAATQAGSAPLSSALTAKVAKAIATIK